MNHVETISLAQGLAYICAMCCAAFGGVPNLIYFNKWGLAVAAVCTILCLNFYGGAAYFAFFGVIGSWIVHAKTRARDAGF